MTRQISSCGKPQVRRPQCCRAQGFPASYARAGALCLAAPGFAQEREQLGTRTYAMRYAILAAPAGDPRGGWFPKAR